MKSNEEVLNIVYKICNSMEFEVNNKGIVTILEKQDHKIQNFLRRLKPNTFEDIF